METLNRERCKALQVRGVHCHQLYLQSGTGLQNIQKIPTYVTNADAGIRTLLTRENYDAIIVSSHHAMLPRLRELGYAKLLIYEAQGLGGYNVAREYLLRARPAISAHANGLLYPNTRHLISLFREIYPAKKHFCFDNCLDTERFTYRPGKTQPAPIMAWVGRIEPNKNWRMFLNIASCLTTTVKNLDIWLFEDDTISLEKADFNARVKQLRLDARLVRHANIPHERMAHYYSRIGDSGGFLCSTSVMEGFGYAVLEAMSCRCPVAASDSDGVRCFITHNETGKLFAQDDLMGAVREARELLIRAELRKRIRDNAEIRAMSQFSPRLYAHRFMNMLAELGLNTSL
ncbi:glycosyltransferase family 4 protein [Paenibacillus sp. IB182496]|uniref:Glycosyltransferase family 4 protein n=2 Tax=Paenibacillus sabuli TaxID=2772509 RepID=A0A927BVI4_9BACL|nr:glycosyltransferase family 4 protein [Paenibacillus sabuli]